jgi:cytochrome c5
MKNTPLIFLLSFFLLTACQGDKSAEKVTEKGETAVAEAPQKSEKIVVAKAEETKTTAPTAKKEAEDGESSGAALHQKNCSKCHGKDYYPKKDSKMDSYQRLHKMVGMCDAQLGTELFPEELQSITDHLNDSFYKFKK